MVACAGTMELEADTTLEKAKRIANTVNAVLFEGHPLGQYRVLGRFNFTPLFTSEIVFSQLKLASLQPQKGSKNRLLYLPLLWDSCLSLLRILLKKPDVLLYMIDSPSSSRGVHDARMDHVYEFLSKSNSTYDELLHTVVFKTYSRNRSVRTKAAFYLESLDILCRAITFCTSLAAPTFSKFDYSPEIISLACERARRLEIYKWKISILSWIFSWSHPKVLFCIDDMRESLVVTAAAQRAGIPVFWFQHGHYSKYQVGIQACETDPLDVPQPTALFVWSEYWKKQLLQNATYIPENRILVSGYPKEIPDFSERIPSDQEILILVPYETIANKDEVKAHLQRFLEDKRVHLYFKVRADIDTETQIIEYGLQQDVRITVIQNHVSIIDRINLVVGTYSTFLYDMVAYGIPVAILETQSTYGRDMVENGVAELIRTGTEGVLDLQRILTTEPKELTRRRELVYGNSLRFSDTLEVAYRKLV